MRTRISQPTLHVEADATARFHSVRDGLNDLDFGVVEVLDAAGEIALTIYGPRVLSAGADLTRAFGDIEASLRIMAEWYRERSSE